ncbi:TPA: replication protein, partial [Klebsiella pneumoniae]|nr:replication protein [Klebsiella pneumoniae]
MNTAEILNFPMADMGIQEQRVADTDDGYTRLANELYEELIGANLTKNQAKVAHAYCRKTYGFNKKMDRIADTQIAKMTRLPRQKVNVAKKELLSMHVLVEEGDLIGPNKNLHEWALPETKNGPQCNYGGDTVCHHDSDSHHGGDSVPMAVTKSVTKTVTALSPEQGHTKDTITKDNKDNINNPPKSPRAVSFDALAVQLPDWLSAEIWSSWVA